MQPKQENRDLHQNIRVEHLEPKWLEKLARELKKAVEPPKQSFLSKFWSWLFATIVPVSLLLGGYFLNAKIERDSLRKNVEKEELQAIIKQKNEMLVQVMSVLTDYRKTAGEIVAECNYDQRRVTDKKAQYGFQIRRANASYKIVDAAPAAKFVFGDEVEGKIDDFLAWMDAIPNICAKTAPSESDLRTKANEVKLLMEQSIVQTQSFLDKEFNLEDTDSEVASFSKT